MSGRGAWKAFIRYVFVERSLHLVVAHAASQQRFLTNGNFLHVKNLCIPDCRSLQVIKKANDIFNGITSSAVCTEVVQSEQGMEYLAGVVEVYRVSRRVEQGIKTAAVGSQVLQQSLRDIDLAWHNLVVSFTRCWHARREDIGLFNQCSEAWHKGHQEAGLWCVPAQCGDARKDEQR
uniref:Synergin gamma C-terminal domain-containing protein n=1 Tax=Eptatretus burgeri TaxID=7764 RepID=A0A8C4NAU7_EPTBU